ncbi:Calpain catalytic domain-containing protein [Rhodovastum atsumiense]|uniref:Calpain catalytic domain-containing protein n=1 Tax=Rhodovastum atsumiense TaxID=504468 RepID=A0A5M6IQ67_9PROT|nr:C2 family cysteine protease [Rhodovastum atsumiense]KAA5610057.1 hypothetical protein F1189_21380 [Rhodovastum atsumiense]CAH2602946.1 Calpain catalytic domain-containing protein [Rhodovastum atsumiense]
MATRTDPRKQLRNPLDDNDDGTMPSVLDAVGPGHVAGQPDTFGGIITWTWSLTPIRTAAPTPTLFLQEAGDTTAISVNDLHQGSIGDCFLLASIGELALWHPDAIQRMIHGNANGTETVTLYRPLSSGASQAVAVTVTNSFPSYSVNNGTNQCVANGMKEIWPQVLEKAVATLCGSYGAIANGGSPVTAMQELTGQPATAMAARSVTLARLQSALSSGELVVMGTAASAHLPYGLVGGHAYMFEGLKTVNGATMVQLGNPWGSSYNPSLIPLSGLAASGIVEVDFGRLA